MYLQISQQFDKKYEQCNQFIVENKQLKDQNRQLQQRLDNITQIQQIKIKENDKYRIDSQKTIESLKQEIFELKQNLEKQNIELKNYQADKQISQQLQKERRTLMLDNQAINDKMKNLLQQYDNQKVENETLRQDLVNEKLKCENLQSKLNSYEAENEQILQKLKSENEILQKKFQNADFQLQQGNQTLQKYNEELTDEVQTLKAEVKGLTNQNQNLKIIREDLESELKRKEQKIKILEENEIKFKKLSQDLQNSLQNQNQEIKQLELYKTEIQQNKIKFETEKLEISHQLDQIAFDFKYFLQNDQNLKKMKQISLKVEEMKQKLQMCNQLLLAVEMQVNQHKQQERELTHMRRTQYGGQEGVSGFMGVTGGIRTDIPGIGTTGLQRTDRFGNSLANTGVSGQVDVKDGKDQFGNTLVLEN